jgi:phenylalanyl-tRNA synthetase beta chain
VGLQEVITYALTTPEREAPLAPPGKDYVRLLNPISSERVAMRHTVLAGVLEVLAANLRHTDDVRLFEIGSVYLPRPGEKLPAEPRRLAVALAGKRGREFWGESGAPAVPLDFYDLKGVVAALLDGIHLSGATYRAASWSALHPGRSAEVLIRDRSLGAGEFDLEALRAALPPRYSYTPVPRFPAALRDIAVVVDDGVPAERVEAEIRAAGGNLLRGVRLFDLYRGESIGAGKKSLAYALTYQAEDRTLTDKEVDKAHQKIADRLKHVLKAQIRGEE